MRGERGGEGRGREREGEGNGRRRPDRETAPLTKIEKKEDQKER